MDSPLEQAIIQLVVTWAAANPRPAHFDLTTARLHADLAAQGISADADAVNTVLEDLEAEQHLRLTRTAGDVDTVTGVNLPRLEGLL